MILPNKNINISYFYGLDVLTNMMDLHKDRVCFIMGFLEKYPIYQGVSNHSPEKTQNLEINCS